jgi:three-Cys-motif partner protein
VPDIAVVGPWAKEKLEALERYLDFYTKVLKNQRWRTIYVDAFAGGGRALVRAEADQGNVAIPLFEPESVSDVDRTELIDGSPRVALNVANPFSRYVFVENDPARCEELEAVKVEFDGVRQIDILRTNAADGIAWVTDKPISKATHRGVAFLDPFGANLEWASVEQLAATGIFEVVVNFGLSMAIQRMLPNSGKIPDGWAKTLDAYFGSRAWFEEVYRERGGGLFNTPGLEKREDYADRLLQLYRARLKAAFGHVSTPRLIRNSKGAPLYYLLWAGPHSKGLQGADHILSMGENLGKKRGAAVSA